MRILWVAVGEARGHLMRAHRARSLMADAGIEIDVVTTNEAGVRFLEALGTPSSVLGRGFSLAFDGRQNMSRSRTDRRMLRYLVSRGPSDVARLRSSAERYELIVDDSFHPAAFVAPLFFDLPVVHVYGRTMLAAFASHHRSRWYGRAVRNVCRRSYARIEHALDGPFGRCGPSTFCLPPLLDEPSERPGAVRRGLGVCRRLVVAYLNPHFSDPAIAEAIERAAEGSTLYAVGEGFADRPGWRATDPRLADKIAAADVVISAPGMATLAAVRAHRVPFVALLSRQPEQQMNWAQIVQDDAVVAVDVDRPENVVGAVARFGSRRIDDVAAFASIRAGRAAWRRTLSCLTNKEYFDVERTEPRARPGNEQSDWR